VRINWRNRRGPNKGTSCSTWNVVATTRGTLP